MAAALAVTVGIAWMSHVRLTPHADTPSMLRLAWTARPERVEQCETQSQEALAKLPAHMRQPQICDSISADYLLEVRRNGVILAQEPVRGGGLRRDRALYVFREVPVPAGEAAIDVRFTRVTPAPQDAEDVQDAESDADGSSGVDVGVAVGAVPPALAFTRRLVVRPGEVVLLTYDSDRRELVLAGAPR
jgi:hypothetical protein